LGADCGIVMNRHSSDSRAGQRNLLILGLPRQPGLIVTDVVGSGRSGSSTYRAGIGCFAFIKRTFPPLERVAEQSSAAVS
jgi:hypothetical protein